jgi:hypothetical protein
LSSERRRSVRRKTFTGLLNTLQTQQGVLEQEVARGHLHPFKERKGQRPLRSEQLKLKEDKDLCKECTRPTLE